MSERIAGYPVWSASGDGVEVRFVGRGPEPRAPAEQLLASVAPAAPPDLAWARQVHSARSLSVERPGLGGEGDAMTTRREGLALAVFTADCLPVLLATSDSIAAVHAGWRGLVGGVLGVAVRGLDDSHAPRAWIGPAIGACCYEVGDEVAIAVADASAPSVLRRGRREKPHLDLAAAARHQLVAAGVAAADITTIDLCTRCQLDRLWSYRRDRDAAGRNVAFIWRQPPEQDQSARAPRAR